LSRYTDRIDVLKNPMLRVGRPVVVLYDLVDGGQVALNPVDATEWRARDPKRYSLTAVPAPQSEPRTTTTGQVVIDLVAAAGGGSAFAGFWLLDITTGAKWLTFSCDYTEWLARGRGQYVPTTPSAH
jgi:hypothetical protein